MEGQMLGNRYLLLEKIGGGGMAVVFKAKCTLLNRFVAIKILRSEFTNDEEFVKRFRIEAQAVASLSHPNVVSIYDVGHEEDLHYIVMEYIDGLTLKEYITKNGALEWKDAVKITAQICSAIEHAHKNNIVHRDIKPHNILLTKEGIAKVTDFGIARAVTSSTITMVGSTIGSVHYFSPEQARGGFIDEKSDLYSLGIALYEMVTGRVPFDGDSPVSVALKHIQEKPIEPVKIVPSLPYGVNEIIMKAIQKDQNIRYQSASAMMNDLNHVLIQPQGGFVTMQNVDSQSTIRMPLINVNDTNNVVRGGSSTDVKRQQKKKNTVTYWIAGITVLLVVVLGIVLAWSVLFKPATNDTFQIEEYRGKMYDEVKPLLDAKGFNISPVWRESTLPKGTIIDQSIKPGENYKSGNFTSLELIISSGPKLSTVPDVREKEYREAQNEITSAGLKWRIERENNKDVPANYVIRTSPEGGQQVAPDTEVTIYVSRGEEVKKTKVPNLVGKTELDAQKLLSDAKLSLGNVFPAGVTKGIVNKQLPVAYEEVLEGETVSIWLTPQEETTPPVTTPDNGGNNGAGNGNGENNGGEGTNNGGQTGGQGGGQNGGQTGGDTPTGNQNPGTTPDPNAQSQN